MTEIVIPASGNWKLSVFIESKDDESYTPGTLEIKNGNTLIGVINTNTQILTVSLNKNDKISIINKQPISIKVIYFSLNLLNGVPNSQCDINYIRVNFNLINLEVFNLIFCKLLSIIITFIFTIYTFINIYYLINHTD